jgi:hypothetical protein
MGFCLGPNGQLTPFNTPGLTGGEVGAITGGIVVGGTILGVLLTRGDNPSPAR